MDTIRKNIWWIGFVALCAGLLFALWAAGRSTRPATPGAAVSQTEFAFTELDNIKGPADARVTLVEFSDFDCPACQAYSPVVDALADAYPADLRVVYKHFPLRQIHPRSESAARAAQAAGLQGKFFEYAARLFENPDDWSQKLGNSVYIGYARDLGLDTARFEADIESDVIKNKVRDDERLALSLGVNATPTFFVNGRKIINPRSLEEFKTVIDAAIAESSFMPASDMIPEPASAE